ncbi:hypothetical protein [Paenibacillus dakarensis]|uniref:hypothetical protein n=1 Tax=Paenibacillus dakarensis TaxID=1527293 RepID=UPI000A7EE3F8|nr:hypothetical protein [Paenibacillus dakarensis]
MEKLISYYSSFDEWGRLDREPLEFKVNFHHIIKNLGSWILQNRKQANSNY